ncbi:unnamed protein product [Moneuplotes crassus]|uniref:Enkurin domain-containing protein n=1 Tax=Euplotes crassus TaxID=5936 RepID=A0AAD1XST0_EUPCR|nr:unnamed protein product [Moneuplotes crassus]
MIQRPRARKTEVASLIAPSDGYRGTLARKGKKPINHIKQNSKKLVETQRQYKLKEKAGAEAKKQKKTVLKQFRGVSSRVYSYQHRPQTCHADRFAEPVDHSLDDENFNTDNIGFPEAPSKHMTIIQKNILKACEKKPAEEHRPQSAIPEYKSQGKVPSYLVKRKQEWKDEEEHKQKVAELKKAPPGTKLLPEAERLETLSQLENSKLEMINTLETLPISLRTMALRNKKIELENKLKETDAAIKLFSRKNVYVAA